VEFNSEMRLSGKQIQCVSGTTRNESQLETPAIATPTIATPVGQSQRLNTTLGTVSSWNGPCRHRFASGTIARSKSLPDLEVREAGSKVACSLLNSKQPVVFTKNHGRAQTNRTGAVRDIDSVASPKSGAVVSPKSGAMVSYKRRPGISVSGGTLFYVNVMEQHIRSMTSQNANVVREQKRLCARREHEIPNIAITLVLISLAIFLSCTLLWMVRTYVLNIR